MKTLSKSLAFVAIAATTILSCTKELEPQAEAPKAGGTQRIEFKAQVNDPSTKATLTTDNDQSFVAQWTVTDHVSLNAKATGYDETKDASWSVDNQCFGGDFTASSYNGTWTYVAKYPYDADGDIPFGSPRVQNGNSYNSAYDVMYGSISYDNADFGKDESGKVFEILMNRLTGIAYFHITGGPDEDVVSATLEATGIAAENVTIANDGASVSSSDENTINAITITFADGTAPKAYDLQLWFNVLPKNYPTLKLTINTTTQTAELNASNLTYSAGKLNKAVLKNLNWEPRPVSKTISEILNEMGQSDVEAGTAVKPLNVDNVVTLTTTGGGNSAKVYGTYPNQDWRIYAANSGNVIISVAKGYELKSVKLTYSENSSPTFSGPDSGTAASVSGSSVTYNVTGSGHIRISAIEVKYVPSTSTYDFETVAKLNELATSTSQDLSGKLTDAVVSFVPDENNAIIKDATGSILLYKANHGLLQGQTFTGELAEDRIS